MPPLAKPTIYFFYEIKFNLKDRTYLKGFINSIFKKEGKRLKSLNYIFCSDNRLLEINKSYLNHDYYTDIITFELSPKNHPVEGEVYISIERVRENAGDLSELFSRELLRVIFHGALHLCGYGDKTDREKDKMREKEEFYLMKYLK